MLPSSDGNVVFRSRAAGQLTQFVNDHIVQGRVIFPAVGYLEMARLRAVDYWGTFCGACC